MKTINVCDTTLCQSVDGIGVPLTFRKKLDIASLLDQMQVEVIELGEIAPTTEGKLLIKSIASAVRQSTISVSVGFESKNVDFIWDALKIANKKRLQVSASLSTSRMEYVYHKKANDMIPMIKETIAKCRQYTEDVEFCADDATRADPEFLKNVLSIAIQEGAKVITLCDTSGNMLPSEFGAFLTKVVDSVEGMKDIAIGVRCNNNKFGLADALAVEAVRNGITEVKANVGTQAKNPSTSLSGIVTILNEKSDCLGIQCNIGAENFAHRVKVIEGLCNLSGEVNGTPFENGVRDHVSSITFTEQDGEENINKEIDGLGYVLSPEDKKRIYASFQQIISKKKQIDLHELEVIVASESMKVPQAYKLVNFVVTTGNMVDTVAHIKLEREGTILDGVSLGNGSVDASFLAIEKILGCHYELDDFQIQAITEGKEAMGQTLVKLRSRGKVYSGSGISTDIVLSAVNAYLNALNKIVYEEERT